MLQHNNKAEHDRLYSSKLQDNRMSRRLKNERPPESGNLRRGKGPTADVLASTIWTRDRMTLLAVGGLLLLAVLLVFGRSLGYGFVNFDDNEYVYDNPHLTHGLTGPSVAWAFTATECYNWHPLTWLSYLLDYQLYGLQPWGYHLTNVLLHAATAIGLFWVLRRMTGEVWPSAFVAAAFAIHPLRVESVVWVSERKDVLSGLFFMLTLGAYVEYVRRPFSMVRYLLVALLFALGLMAKPMLVTLPFVLLLLDCWPLERLRWGGSCTAIPGATVQQSPQPMWRLVVEKTPLFLLAAASCAATSAAQQATVVRLDLLPLGSRAANAMISCAAYMGLFLYPANLAAFYPHQGLQPPMGQVAVASLILVGICLAAVVARRRCPYLFVGWYWYLGMLVPVIGLVQVGRQAMADRYTYLPQIGLLIAVAWAAKQAFGSWAHRVWAGRVAAGLILAVLMGCAWRQTAYWRDSETLWRHALDCTANNGIAGNNLGIILREEGKIDEAIDFLESAMRVNPNDVMVLNNLALALNDREKHAEALALLEKALELRPDEVHTHANLGLVLADCGRIDDALAQCQKALDIQPDDAETHNNFGNALVACGRLDEAISHFQAVLAARPEHAEAHYNLGIALLRKRQFDEAIVHFGKALAVKPRLADAHNNLGIALANRGRFDEAIAEYQKALAIKPEAAEPRNNLGTSLAKLGRLDEAIAQFEAAMKIKPDYADARRNLDFVRSQREAGQRLPDERESNHP
jgi:protein O-mannosyl-transferase